MEYVGDETSSARFRGSSPSTPRVRAAQQVRGDSLVGDAMSTMGVAQRVACLGVIAATLGVLHVVIIRQDIARIRRPIQLALVGHPEIPVAAPRHKRLLNPDWAENATFRAIAADALRHGKYVHMENAFADDFARQTAAAIEGDLDA